MGKFGNGIIPWHWKISIVLYIFSPALNVSDILKFYILYLPKVDQGHGIQISQ